MPNLLDLCHDLCREVSPAVGDAIRLLHAEVCYPKSKHQILDITTAIIFLSHFLDAITGSRKFHKDITHSLALRQELYIRQQHHVQTRSDRFSGQCRARWKGRSGDRHV